MALFENPFIKFAEVRAKLQDGFSPQEWSDKEGCSEIQKYIASEVYYIIFGPTSGTTYIECTTYCKSYTNTPLFLLLTVINLVSLTPCEALRITI